MPLSCHSCSSPVLARSHIASFPVCLVFLQDYYDYLQSFGHPGPDLMRHVQDLPISLGTDMTTELYKPTVAKIPLFRGVTSSFLESITRGLNLCVFLKGACGTFGAVDCSMCAEECNLQEETRRCMRVGNGATLDAGEYIYREGDLVPALRICQKGKVAIIRQGGAIADMVCDGGHFGMQSLLSPGPCSNSAVGLSNCDIMFLSRDLIASSMRRCSISSAAVRKNFGILCAPVHHA